MRTILYLYDDAHVAPGRDGFEADKLGLWVDGDVWGAG